MAKKESVVNGGKNRWPQRRLDVFLGGLLTYNTLALLPLISSFPVFKEDPLFVVYVLAGIVETIALVFLLMGKRQAFWVVCGTTTVLSGSNWYVEEYLSVFLGIALLVLLYVLTRGADGSPLTHRNP